MNGLILNHLGRVIREDHGEDAWTATHDLAGLTRRLYLPSTDYPDSLVSGLVTAAAEATEVERSRLLARVGQSLVPDLLAVYDVHVRPEWAALELVANFGSILEAGCAANRFTSYAPPEIRISQVDEATVRLDVRDADDCCHLFEGILHGIGDHYGQPLHVEHRPCAHNGADACTFRVERAERSGVAARRPVGSEADSAAVADRSRRA